MERETDYFLEDDDRQLLDEDPEWLEWLEQVAKQLDEDLK